MDENELAKLQMESYNYCTTGYKHILIWGLPHRSGKYFVVLQEDHMLVLTQLSVDEKGMRCWSIIKTGSEIEESRIRMWKLIEA